MSLLVWFVTVVLLVVFGPRGGHPQDLTPDGCPAVRTEVTVEPEADVTIGALLSAHDPGPGVFGCGRPLREGVETFEAMRWAVDLLNQDNGVINGESVQDSFIPGVKIGLKAFDNCGHQEAALQQLTEMFPVLTSGSAMCGPDPDNSSFLLGVLDMVGVTAQPRVAEAVFNYVIPAIPLAASTTLLPEHVAKLLTEAAHDMEWQRVAVLHADDEASIHTTKQLGHLTSTAGGSPCIAAVQRVSGGEDIRNYRQAVTQLTSRLTDDTAVLVIGQEVAFRQVLQTLAEMPDLAVRFQWLFSWVPPPSSLRNLGAVLDRRRVLCLAPHPGRLAPLEERWRLLQDPSSPPQVTDIWFQELVTDRKNCRVRGGRTIEGLPPCANLVLQESPADVLARTARSLPIVHGVFTFGHAFRKAWSQLCAGTPGICPDLRKLTRRQFVAKYLDPLEFDHSPQQRSPPGLRGHRSPGSGGGEVEGMTVALTLLTFDPSLGVGFQPVVAYDASAAEVLDSTFRYTPSPCPADGCRGCVRVRQSRLDDVEEPVATDGLVTVGQPEDALIPLVMPLHEAGPTPLGCGASVDPIAVQNLEAALWTLDRINADPTLLPGIRLGAVVVDTCSSSFKAAQRLTSFLSTATDGATVSITSAFGAISSASKGTASASVEMLSPLNITTVVTGDFLRHRPKRPLADLVLQIPPPAEITAEAVIETLKYLGWTYVSTVYGGEDSGGPNYEAFRKVAQRESICLAVEQDIKSIEEEDMDRLLSRLLAAKDLGAKVVVMWTPDGATRALEGALGRAVESGRANTGDLILVAIADTVDVGSESEFSANIKFLRRSTDVRDFVMYFRNASPSRFQRNPWLRDLVQQQCPDCSEAPSIGYIPSSSSEYTILSVMALATGLSRLRSEFCPATRGLCPQMLRQPHLRPLLHQYILESKSVSIDPRGPSLEFTVDGYGNIPVDILNLKKGPGGIWSYQKVGTYNGLLTDLKPMVSYEADGGEVPMERVHSECTENCGRCSRKKADFMVMESRDQLYIAAALGVHAPTRNPLECGALIPDGGIQPLEALLWALDQVNASPRLLPGIHLGAVVLDTCNSRERAARDVSNLFGDTADPRLPPADQIIGIVAGQNADVVQPIADITTPLLVTTVSTEAAGGAVSDTTRYPYLLRLAVPHTVVARALVTLLKQFRWSYVSVVHSADPWTQGDLFTAFRAEARHRGVHLATMEAVPVHSDTWRQHMEGVVRRLKEKRNEGARVVVVLLNPDQTDQLLTAVQRAPERSDFVWVSVDNVEAFHRHPEQSLGAVTMRVASGVVPDFKRYIESLSLRNHSTNPWFREYWESVFGCRGAACYSDSTLRQVAFMQHPLVPRTVNAVLALAFGLDALRNSMCSSPSQGLCHELKEHPEFRELIFNYTRTANITRPDASPVRFTSSNYGETRLDVFSFRQVGSNAHAFVAVGRYSDPDGLTINASRVKGYDAEGSEFSLYDMPSQCNSSSNASCPGGNPTGVLQMVESDRPRFTLAVVMPVHRQGRNFFTCGPLTDTSIFQNLAAITYAVNRINLNATLLPGVELNALVLDSCGRRQRAEEMLYSYFANNGLVNGEEIAIPPKSVVAALTFGGEEVSTTLAPILSSAFVTHIKSPSTSTGKKGSSPPSPSPSHELQIVLDFLDHFGWRYVYLVHGNTDYGREAHYRFSKRAKGSRVCVAGTLSVERDSPVSEVAQALRDHLESRKARVVVLLIDDPHLAYTVLSAIEDEGLMDQFVWVATEGWPEDPLLSSTGGDIFKVKVENRDIPEFRQHLARLTPGQHEPLPDPWFEEFWQHQFRCQLTHSSYAQRHYSDVCMGGEKQTPHSVLQDRFVYQTVRAVEGVARGLHAFLTSRCDMDPSAVDSVDDCGMDARRLLDRNIQKELGNSVLECEECNLPESTVPYVVVQLRNNSDGQPTFPRVGFWKDGRLTLNDDAPITFSGGVPPVSVCLDKECLHCQPRAVALTGDGPAQSIYSNFRTVWGIVATALSVLGMALVAICTMYFLMAFPVTVGSTVLGYMILAGLFALYAVNFAFIVLPTEGTCGVRRFALGLAYAIIFSGMLVKVMNTWRLMGYHGNRVLADGTRLSSPAGLLVIAVGLVIIQVVLSAAWLILMPPRTGMHEQVWRCAPPSTFEEGLVISLVYVMLLLAVTALFALLTWRSGDTNREPRWILACCVLVGLVWLAWTVLSTQLPPVHRDTAIVGANLISATVVMLCLYLRKVYLYSKLTRQARDREMKARLQPTKYPHNLYGFVPGPLAAVSPVLYGSQASLNGKKIFGGPPSRLELIACPPEDSRSDSSGSVQVQAADLYPLDMYDGGSQFQPMASLYGSNHTLVLDDAVTFTR